MFQLALRLWTGQEMIYPVKFSVIFDPTTRKSSVRAFVKNDKIITFDYMMITPFNAINGPIFEKDIIVVDGDEEHLKIVDFDEEKGIYIARDINGSGYIKMNNSRKYETAGNIFEDSDLLGQEQISNNPIKKEETSEIKEESSKGEDVLKENPKSKKTKKDKKQKEPVKEKIQLSEEPEPISEKREDKPEEEKTSGEIKEEPVEKELNEKEEQQTEEISTISDAKNAIHDDKTVEESSTVDETSVEKEEIEKGNEVHDTIDNLPEIDESSYLEDSSVSKEVNILVNSGETKDINIHFISVFGNNNIGGYAFTFECEGVKDTYKGSEGNTNSKKIDLSGLISALEMLDGSFNVTIYTNSQYVVYPFFKGWIHKWKEANWFKNETDRIQNYELWSELYEFYNKYNIKWNFVETLTEDMKECLKFANEEI